MLCTFRQVAMRIEAHAGLTRTHACASHISIALEFQFDREQNATWRDHARLAARLSIVIASAASDPSVRRASKDGCLVALVILSIPSKCRCAFAHASITIGLA